MVFTYLKVAAALVLLGIAYYLGGLPGKAALASLKAQQASLVATELQRQAANSLAEIARLNTVIATYEQNQLDPLALSLGSRVYHYIQIGSCPLPGTAAHPGGTVGPGPVTTAPDSVEPALNAYIEACSRDATRLDALIAAWPH
jgi:hypothetical protein